MAPACPRQQMPVNSRVVKIDHSNKERVDMSVRNALVAVATVTGLLMLPGCAVFSGQSTTGEMIDDSAITTQIKTKMLESKDVPGTAVSVETLKGTVSLSGFVKTPAEKAAAESIARGVKGVTGVNNAIIVR
jgi:hyperosmotically inducible protein